METSVQQSDIFWPKARYQPRGRFLVIAPGALFLVAIIAFFFSSFIGSEELYTVVRLVRVLAGLLGAIAVLTCMIALPIGVILLGVSARMFEGPADARSAQGTASVVPAEIKGWNWGAAGLGWLWGVSHNAWMSLLVFVPFVALFMWIVLGVKGSEWAWQSAPWQSVEQFKATQEKWKLWGILSLVLQFLPLIIALFFFSTFIAFLPALLINL